MDMDMDIMEIIDMMEETITKASSVPLTGKIMLDKEELLDYIDKKSAVFYPGTAGSQSKIIGLSTCQSAESYERIIVFGVLTEIAD